MFKAFGSENTSTYILYVYSSIVTIFIESTVHNGVDCLLQMVGGGGGCKQTAEREEYVAAEIVDLQYFLV